MMTGTTGEPPQSQGRYAGVTPAYLGLVLIWSATPLSVVLSLRDFDAIWSLTIRMVLAALLASLLLRLLGLRLARDPASLKLYAVGSLSMFGAMLLTYLGARHLPSGMISVLFGLSPLMVGFLSQVFLRESRLSSLQWSGMLLGITGLAVIFLEGESMAAIHAPSVFMVLAGVLCYAVSAMWIKRLPHQLPPLVQTCGALWVSALGCVLVLPVLGGAVPDHMPGAVSVSALLFSASMGSIVAMFCYFFLLQRIAVGTMALTTLITPVFALLLGMLINHERFHASTLWGMGLIMLGLAGYYEQELRRFLVRPAMA